MWVESGRQRKEDQAGERDKERGNRDNCGDEVKMMDRGVKGTSLHSSIHQCTPPSSFSFFISTFDSLPSPEIESREGRESKKEVGIEGGKNIRGMRERIRE